MLIQGPRLLPGCGSTILSTKSKLVGGKEEVNTTHPRPEPSDTQVKGWTRTSGKQNEWSERTGGAADAVWVLRVWGCHYLAYELMNAVN